MNLITKHMKLDLDTRFRKLILIFSFLTLASCASITQGTNQVISFSIDPIEAKCNVVNKDNATIGTVSGRSNLLQVSKGAGDLIASCSADSYEPKTTRIASTTQTAGVLGVAIDFGITDMLTGAMWKYPDHVAIVMDKKQAR
jgi:hypothetical protein